MVNYVNETLLALAKGSEKERLTSFDVSPVCYIQFGTYGLGLIRLFGNVSKYKYVADWSHKTAEEINKELNEQEWQRPE